MIKNLCIESLINKPVIKTYTINCTLITLYIPWSISQGTIEYGIVCYIIGNHDENSSLGY